MKTKKKKVSGVAKTKAKPVAKAKRRTKKMSTSRASYELNEKELKVWEAFPSSRDGEDKFITLAELAAEAFPKKGTAPKSKPNSWVRNSLRKLCKLGLVKHKGAKSGLYTRTKLTPKEVLKNAEEKGLFKTASADGVEKKPKKKAAKKKVAAEKKAAPEKASSPPAEKTEATAEATA